MGLLDAVGNVVGAGISAAAAAGQAKKQREHDIEMAGINQQNALEQMATSQEYNKENMAIQNQYQLDQWNRENEYNDPSAVAARYRAAGINPRAALGGAASGAGVSGGLSSAPSGSSSTGGSTGHSSTLYHSNPLATLSHIGTDIGNALRAERSVDAEVALKNAQALEQNIENEYKEQNLVADLLIKRAEYEEKMQNSKTSESQKKLYEKEIESIDQQIKESQERTKNYSIVGENVKAQTENTKESTKRVKAETAREDLKLQFERRFNGAPMELLNSTPGSAAFLSYAVTQQVEDDLPKLVETIKNTPNKFPDPVGDFVRSNWPKLKAWLDDIDYKFSGGKIGAPK